MIKKYIIVAEILEMAGERAKKDKRKRKTIKPRDIMLAIKDDDELASVCHNVIIPGAGVVPYIHPELKMKKKGKGNIKNYNDLGCVLN